jgi:hypothetical protein
MVPACLHMGSLHHLQYYYFQQPTQISHVRPPRDNMNSKTPPGPEPTCIAPRRTEPCDRAVYLGISDTLSTPGPFRRAMVRLKDPLSMDALLQYNPRRSPQSAFRDCRRDGISSDCILGLSKCRLQCSVFMLFPPDRVFS